MHARANLFGLGPGCYPKARTLRPPYHSFCWCRVRSRPDLQAAGAREVPGGEAAYLRSLSPDEAGRVMGSKERAARVMDGARVEDVTNAGKDAACRLARVGDGAALRHALGAENVMMANPQAVPGAEKAMIHPDKLRRYALDPDSEVGAHKARVFAAVLGFTQENAEDLEQQLLRGLPDVSAVRGELDKHGQRYKADVAVTGPGGSGVVRTAWIVENEEVPPRLTSAYVLRGKK